MRKIYFLLKSGEPVYCIFNVLFVLSLILLQLVLCNQWKYLFMLYIFSSCYTLTKPLVCFKEYSLLMMLLLCCMYVKNCMEDLLKLKFDQVRCKLRWKIILYFLYLHFIFLCFLKVVFLLGPKTQLIRFSHIFFFFNGLKLFRSQHFKRLTLS